MPSQGLARWSTINKVLKELVGKLGFRLEIDGAEEMSQTGDGLYVKLGNQGTVNHPWKGVIISGGLAVLGGYCNDIAVAGTTIGAGNGFAYLRVNFALDEEDGFVYTATLTGATLGSASSVPGDSPGSGTFYIPLFQYEGVRVISQSATRHMRVAACDDGSGDGKVLLNVLQS